VILRATFYKKLNEALSTPDPSLRREDFLISEGPPNPGGQKASNSAELRVAYAYNTDYFFHFSFSINQEGNFTGKVAMAPGQHTSRVSFDINTNLDTLIGHIKLWKSALEDELIALPAKRRFDEQQRLLDSLMDQFRHLPEEYFTREEAEDMRAKLDEIESRFSAHINSS
jgi:hypothetical protein